MAINYILCLAFATADQKKGTTSLNFSLISDIKAFFFPAKKKDLLYEKKSIINFNYRGQKTKMLLKK